MVVAKTHEREHAISFHQTVIITIKMKRKKEKMISSTNHLQTRAEEDIPLRTIIIITSNHISRLKIISTNNSISSSTTTTITITTTTGMQEVPLIRSQA